jgi:hypothetical protein
MKARRKQAKAKTSKARPRRAKRPVAGPRTFEQVKAANLADPFHAARIVRIESGERLR